jgi:hypothetical protein
MLFTLFAQERIVNFFKGGEEAGGVDYWVAAAREGGFLICLLGLAYGLYKLGVWLGPNAILPLVQRHIRFVDDISASVVNIAQAIQTMSKDVAEIKEQFRSRRAGPAPKTQAPERPP